MYDSQFYRSYIRNGFIGFFALGLTKLKSRAGLLSGTSGKKSPSKILQVVGRIQFFMVLGPRPPFPCWLLAGICP